MSTKLYFSAAGQIRHDTSGRDMMIWSVPCPRWFAAYERYSSAIMHHFLRRSEHKSGRLIMALYKSALWSGSCRPYVADPRSLMHGQVNTSSQTPRAVFVILKQRTEFPMNYDVAPSE